MKKIKQLFIIAISAIVLFNTSSITTHAAETQATENSSFLPFRSYIANYITTHSTDKNQVIINEWLKVWYEETTFTGKYSTSSTDLKKWSSKYYSSYSLIGGDFVSESNAKGKNITFNCQFDQFLANTINSNGFDFINQWLNATNASPSFSGQQLFIDYFKSTDYQKYPATSLAFVELTNTADGQAWLNQYSYSKTGSVENSVGVSLLKLLSMNWTNLNDNQKNWCQDYLPFLLSDYSTNGNNAIASQKTNSYLYDFMARSIKGATYTTKSKVSNKTCQQEFFDYVVTSKQGFGSFLQNLINGRTYVANTPNRKISGIDLSLISAASGIFGISNSDGDADYTASSLGDNDLDWFGHGLYLQENKKNCPDFNTALTLIKNNESTNWLYNDWISRFKSYNSAHITWSNVTDYVITSPTDSSGYGGHYYLTGSGRNSRTYADNQTSDGSAIRAYFHEENCIFKMSVDNRDMTFTLNNFEDIVVEFNTPISYKTSSLTINFEKGYMMNYAGDNVLIQAISPITNDQVASSVVQGNSSVTMDIPDSAWTNNKYLKLKFTYNPYTAVNNAFNHSNLGTVYTHGYKWSIGSIVENYDGCKSGLDGYTWTDWQTKYSDDYSQVLLYRNAISNSAIEESELINATIKDYSDKTEYIYAPKILSKKQWTITVSKDLGVTGSSTSVNLNSSLVSGSASNSASCSYSAGSYSTLLSDIVRYHIPIDGNSNNTNISNWLACTTVSATATGTLTLKATCIKQNIKTITVKSSHNANIFLRSSTGELLATKSGSGTITLDVSNISSDNKLNCYLVITYSGSNSNTTTSKYNTWNYYPAASVSVTAKVQSVILSY